MGRQMTPEEVDTSYRDWPYLDAPAGSTPWTPLWRAVLDEIRPDDRVLDVGCGAGHLSALRFARDGSHGFWTGIDFSRVAIEAARRRKDTDPAASFEVMDGSKLVSWMFDVSDVVVFSEVLEHVEDDLTMLALVSKGRRIVLTVPNFDSAGHCRYFQCSEEVLGRYGPLLDPKSEIHSYPVESATPGRRWFLLSGVRA